MKKILLTALIVLMMISIVRAEDIEQEIEIETGHYWGFPGYVVTYELGDPSIAELTKSKTGDTFVRFINPGDVYVRATFYSGGQAVESELYLFHVTGEARGANAVDRNTFAQEVLILVNAERARVGAPPLRLANDLNRYADIRAKEIVKQFSHTRPNGENGALIIPACRYRGENLSAGAASPQSVMYQWMHSPKHRENILFADYEELGVGYCFDDEGEYKHYWVQLFRTR